MGMFDYVNFKMKCPSCGVDIGSFQTKDQECELAMLEPDSLVNFYTFCTCGNWIEFSRKFPEHAARDVPLTQEQVEAMGFVLSTSK